MSVSIKGELVLLFGGALFFYIALIVGLFLFQDKFIYFPDSERQKPASYSDAEIEVVAVRTDDGLTLEGWYRPPRDGKPVIVVFHGNAAHMGMSAWKVRPFMDAGYGALLPAWRGYAGNPGVPSESGLRRDARAFLGWLEKEKKIPQERTVLYGESLGTGIAVEMAATDYRAVKAVILESPYTSFVDLARRQFPYIPFLPALVRDHYASIDKIGRVGAPLLVLSGEADVIVPNTIARRLYEKANDPKSLISIPLAGHNNLYMHGTAERVLHFLSGV